MGVWRRSSSRVSAGMKALGGQCLRTCDDVVTTFYCIVRFSKELPSTVVPNGEGAKQQLFSSSLT